MNEAGGRVERGGLEHLVGGVGGCDVAVGRQSITLDGVLSGHLLDCGGEEGWMAVAVRMCDDLFQHRRTGEQDGLLMLRVVL